MLSRLRTVLQLAVVAAAAVAGVRMALGVSRASIETHCPFGGLETLYSVLTRQQFSCAMGETNLALFAALVALALLTRKSFCGWLCPVGAVHEWLGRGARALRRAARGGGKGPAVDHGLVAVPRRLDRGLRWIRVPILAAILVATGLTAELIFRPFDPYYVLFSGHGHDVVWWSYLLLGALLAGGAAVSMLWCRYLCPLGAALWPLARVGVLRIRRDEQACTACGRCDRSCPQALAVSSAPEVRDGDCTLCLECSRVCPTHGALRVAGPRRLPAVPAWVVPVLLVAATVAGLAGGEAFALPSFSRVYDDAATGETRTVVLVVDGVRCVDTAARAAAQLQDVPGVVQLVAFASRGELRIEYDAAAVDPEALRAALEGPALDPATGSYLFDQFRVVETRTP